jgi:hypothetical protein
MKFTHIVLGLLTLFVACAGFAAPPANAPVPTFSKDVAPILYKNCASCHRPGEIAPMSLLTYEDARPWAASIKEKVAGGEMPPWHATQPAGTFANDRRLSAQDKATLLAWAAGGAPKGDSKDLPPAPKFPVGWEIGTPDVVISMPEPYSVPAAGTIDYQIFTMPTNFTTDKWVQAIEVRPGTRAVVHHILAFCQEPGEPRPQAYKTTIPKFPERNRKPSESVALIASTAPGTNALTFPPGQAMLIRAGSKVTFQIHYTANGTAATDRSSLGIIFAKQPPELEVRNAAFSNPTLKIQPGADNEEVDSEIEFTENSHIWALLPHTHLRGKSWEYRLTYPDGRTEVVLSVPKYDFNWQTYYIFAKPLAVPKGARLEGIAHYDNSTANKSNPDPTKLVKWGQQTWEEMQYTGITFTIDPQSAGEGGASNSGSPK